MFESHQYFSINIEKAMYSVYGIAEPSGYVGPISMESTRATRTDTEVRDLQVRGINNAEVTRSP